jgi:hypothetical protein
MRNVIASFLPSLEALSAAPVREFEARVLVGYMGPQIISR